MKRVNSILSIATALIILLVQPSLADSTAQADGTIHIPAFDLPESSLLNKETRTALKDIREHDPRLATAENGCPSMEGASREQMPVIRQCKAEAFYRSPYYKVLRERYPVTMTPQVIGGVYTEVFTPKDGIAPKNTNRVLIDLHGGHFMGGARTVSHEEAIPIASTGKIKVISIDYRIWPEYVFPAASEDVAASLS